MNGRIRNRYTEVKKPLKEEKGNRSYGCTKDKGFFWSYPGSELSFNTINILPERHMDIKYIKSLVKDNVYGICTDYPELLRD